MHALLPLTSADLMSRWQSLTASTTHRNERHPMAGDPPNRALQRHRCRRRDALSTPPGLVPSGVGSQPRTVRSPSRNHFSWWTLRSAQRGPADRALPCRLSSPHACGGRCSDPPTTQTDRSRLF